MKRYLVALLFISSLSFQSKADEKLLYPYKSVYFLYDRRDIFQFSFRIKLLTLHSDEERKNNLEGLFLGYTQLSFWKQGSGSVGNDNPYIYSNYNPEIHYIYQFNHPIKSLTSVQIGVEHQSDGLGKQFDPLHREWNRVYVTPMFNFFDDHLIVRTKLWYPDVSSRYNPDIAKYMGYGQVTFSTNLLANFWQPKTELSLWKGSARNLNEFSWRLENSIQVPKELLHFSTPAAFFMQWYYGYGESLKTYNKRTDNIRFGISLLI